MKKYTPKQFAPIVRSEWWESLKYSTEKTKSEILQGILQYPSYNPDLQNESLGIWEFIKSQINKDYHSFVEKCAQNAEIAKTYWGNERSTNDIPTYNEGQPITIPLPDQTIPLPKKEIIKEKKTKEIDCLYIGTKQTIKMTQKEFDEISNTAENPLILIKLLADMEEYVINTRKKSYESYYLACLKWLRKGIAIDTSIDFNSESKRLNLPLTTLQKRIISESGGDYENK